MEGIKLLCVVLAAIGLGYYLGRGGDLAETQPKRSALVHIQGLAKAQMDFCGPPAAGVGAVSFEMVYGEEMRPWMEAASDVFLRRCPNIQVKARAVPDIEAADAILAGRLKPTLWAPSDELSLHYLAHGWKQRGGEPPFRGETGTSLVESPLVLLIWQDRLRLLSALLRRERSAEGQWFRFACALIPRDPDMNGMPIEAMVPGTWLDWYAPFAARLAAAPQPVGDEPLPPLEEVKSWGRVKIGHAKPTRDSAGAAALYLMAYDYVLPPAERQALEREETGGGSAAAATRADRIVRRFEKAYAENRAKLGKWLRRCDAGLDAPPPTTAALTKALFDVGPSLYDGVVTYEHLALPLLARIDRADAMRKLVILYPQPTLIARHPLVFFDARADQEAAVRRWLDFLLSVEMQEKAVEAGFRPVNPAVTIRGHNVEKNRFLRLRRYGVLLQPQWTEAPRPGGGQIRDLLNLWGEVTGRN